MKCGIVILNYNDFSATIELLENIKNSREIDNIVVVDNFSQNESYEQLKKYQSEKISVIQSEKNGGYSYGNNFGARYLIENFHPDIIGIANPDVIFDDSLVKRVKELFALYPDYALITGFNLKPDGTSAARPFWENEGKVSTLYNAVLWEIAIRPFVNFSKKIFRNRRPGKYERYVEKIRTSTKDINEVWAVLGCLYFVRTKDFEAVGMLDEKIFMFGEENILAYKIHKLGKKLGIAGGVTFIHAHREPKDDTPIKKMDRGMRFINLSEYSAVYYFNNYITKNKMLQIFYKILMRVRWLKSITACSVKKFLLRIK